MDCEREIARLAGVIETARSIGLAAARSPEEKIRAPAAPAHLREQSLRVMRVDGSFEAVEQEHMRRAVRCVRWRIEAMDFEEVIVRRFPSLHSCWNGLTGGSELAPEGLRVAAGNPPGWSVVTGTVAHDC